MSRIPLEDRLDIQELVARYAFLCDTAQYEQVCGLFAPDGVFDESVLGMPVARGMAELLKLFCGEGGNTSYMIHINCNHLIHAYSGDAASGTSHLHVEAGMKDGRHLRFFGYYADEYVRADGRWLLRQRKLHAIAPVELS